MISIYSLTHKPFEPPKNPIYKPLRVGAAGQDCFGYLGDDTKDNISEKNDTFSELTGCYWIWKNDKESGIVGTCHYRRYLLNKDGGLFSKEEIENLLNKEGYELITTKELELNFSYQYGFSKNHKPYYLKELQKTIEVICPEYLPTYNYLVNRNHTYFGNMIICKKKLYDSYMEWLFGILFAMDNNITIEEEDSYHRRIYGFISEFLLYVYCKHNKIKVFETMVGMVGEKAEVKEIKAVLAEYLEAGDWHRAKSYFLAEHKKRPDILMEASDVNNELHLSMEVIAIAEHEADCVNDAFSHRDWIPLLEREYKFEDLMWFCRRLNEFVQKRLLGNPSKEEDVWIKENHVSEMAVYVSEVMYGRKE